ncbi:gamma-glutamyltranspeptidase/glutathione hydrolase [Rhodopseudomonas rhenobacensis]|uniref:Gamma-glutamyltranspeptidase/glutathione hydrolase n=1 Tax=Rhodopseudomonas rhenobacensis TaxID=87461 RepID=A0A7W7Z8H8_9BRAD|nr:gamma-glutamyltransferase family protein [Rhodopseudomonas rhenobacensis]MBB5049959.1 gamma-glutamyltranspeptidase/glutathione hydrolase [Rhodopseudomonas rhenobacensis]
MSPFTSLQGEYNVARRPVMSRNMVATSHSLSAQAGLRMLLKGGSAADAAIASAICQTVVEPTSTGVGGDAFAIVSDTTGELHGLNASGRAPAAWTSDRFAGRETMPPRGWDSVTVPGAVSGWVALWKRFGRLPFPELFAPAIEYARNGFHVTPTVAALWLREAKEIATEPGFAETFLPRGRAPEAGELFVNTHLAVSLERIAQTEGEDFYRGAIAQKIAEHSRLHGGAMTTNDLAAHTADWTTTLLRKFRGVELHELPPNGQGVTALMALGMLDHVGIENHHPDSAQAMHLQIEALKLAFADVHAHVADPASMAIDRHRLLDDDYLRKRARLIDPERASTNPSTGIPTHGSTIYVAAADRQGMMVSFIQSTFVGFGSGIVVSGTGIHLQNRGAAFSLEAGHPNQVGPSKRPLHTIIPAFLNKAGKPLMSFGVVGGPMQPQAHVQLVLRTQLFRQNPQAALNAPRWLVMDGNRVAVETTMPRQELEALRALGHDLIMQTPDNTFGFGGGQIIQRFGDGYIGASDHRKDGMVVGF